MQSMANSEIPLENESFKNGISSFNISVKIFKPHKRIVFMKSQPFLLNFYEKPID